MLYSPIGQDYNSNLEDLQNRLKAHTLRRLKKDCLDLPAKLDPVTITTIQNIIARLRDQGISILLTDHREKETLGVTDRAYVVHQGKVLVSGTPDEVLANKRAQEVYFGRQDETDAAVAA